MPFHPSPAPSTLPFHLPPTSGGVPHLPTHPWNPLPELSSPTRLAYKVMRKDDIKGIERGWTVNVKKIMWYPLKLFSNYLLRIRKLFFGEWDRNIVYLLSNILNRKIQISLVETIQKKKKLIQWWFFFSRKTNPFLRPSSNVPSSFSPSTSLSPSLLSYHSFATYSRDDWLHYQILLRIPENLPCRCLYPLTQ